MGTLAYVFFFLALYFVLLFAVVLPISRIDEEGASIPAVTVIFPISVVALGSFLATRIHAPLAARFRYSKKLQVLTEGPVHPPKDQLMCQSCKKMFPSHYWLEVVDGRSLCAECRAGTTSSGDRVDLSANDLPVERSSREATIGERRVRMTRRKRNIIVAVLAIVLAGVGFLIWSAYRLKGASLDAYAAWWTADLVIEHMERNGGSWPRSWDELRPTSEAYGGTASTTPRIKEFRPRASIEDLQQRVELDWKADPKELVKAEFTESGPPFRVIWLRNGSSIFYEGREPNEMVLHYLKWKQKEGTRSSGPANGS